MTFYLSIGVVFATAYVLDLILGATFARLAGHRLRVVRVVGGALLAGVLCLAVGSLVQLPFSAARTSVRLATALLFFSIGSGTVRGWRAGRQARHGSKHFARSFPSVTAAQMRVRSR